MSNIREGLVRVDMWREPSRHVEVWSDASGAVSRAAELFAANARQAVASRASFRVALSGGSTPRALYELLAGDAYCERVPWQQVHVFWSDERCVVPDDEESNYRMAKEALLEHVPVPESQIHRMRGEEEPELAAREYEQVLKSVFGSDVPRFDLILLGMGEDGHTASLFPNSEALDDNEHLVRAVFVEKLRAHRLTMTFRVINAAANIIFLVTGESKAEALRAVFEGRENGCRYPARRVRPTRGESIWLLDRAAAKLLSGGELQG